MTGARKFKASVALNFLLAAGFVSIVILLSSLNLNDSGLAFKNSSINFWAYLTFSSSSLSSVALWFDFSSFIFDLKSLLANETSVSLAAISFPEGINLSSDPFISSTKSSVIPVLYSDSKFLVSSVNSALSLTGTFNKFSLLSDIPVTVLLHSK